MKPFNGYDKAKENVQYRGSSRLPIGGYVCRILGAKVDPGKNGASDMLILQFDIAEGEYTNFYQNQYNANRNDNKKYKGNARIYIPKGDGTKEDGWTANTFAGWMDSIEKSNKDYVWQWDEKTLKGKIVGIIFGETGTRMTDEKGEQKDVIYTEARFGMPAENIRKGDFPTAKFKTKNHYGEGSPTTPAAGNNGFMSIPDGITEELPFN